MLKGNLQSLETTLRNLEKVLSLNSKINSTLKIEELLTLIMTTAAQVVQAQAASLMLLDELTQELVFRIALGETGGALKEKFRVRLGEGIAGWVAQKGESLLVNDVRRDPRFAGRFDQATGFESRAILCVPMRARDRLIGVLEAINPEGRRAFSEGDLHLFQTFADQAAISIENAKLHDTLVKQELADRELKIAREIQQHFLPQVSEIKTGIDVACKNIPAREVSGDFYDVICLDDKKTGIMIGDVSGKGVPASLYMVRAISDARFLAPRSHSPAGLLTELNRRLVRDSRFGIFTTLLYLDMNPEAGTAVYASAGHHPILHRQSGTGALESMRGESGVPLGLFEEAVFPENKLALATGDAYFLYTDGITEARNSQGDEFGLDRLMKSVRGAGRSAQEYSDRILADLASFTRGAEQHDDVTLVTLRVP